MLATLQKILRPVRGVFLRNFLNLFFNQFTNILVALLVTPVLYQRLGEASYGLVQLGLSVVLLCSIGVSYGYHLNAPKRLALLEDRSAATGKLLNELIATRLFIALLLAFLLFGAAFFFGFFKTYRSILYGSLILLFSEALFPMVYFQGKDRLSWLSIANFLAKISYLLLVLCFVAGPSEAPYVNTFFGVGALWVYLLFWRLIYRRENIAWAWVRWERIQYRLRENVQFFLSSVAGHVSIHGGIIILSGFVSHTQLGKYALAQRIALLMRMVPIFFIQAILQKAAVLSQQDPLHYRQTLRRLFRAGLLLSLAAGILVALTARWIIYLLAGDYVPYSEGILQLLAFVPFVSMLNFHNMIHILVTENKNLLNKATWITALWMLLTALAGSHYYGGYGLAIALLLTELVSVAVHSLLLSNQAHAQR